MVEYGYASVIRKFSFWNDSSWFSFYCHHGLLLCLHPRHQDKVDKYRHAPAWQLSDRKTIFFNNFLERFSHITLYNSIVGRKFSKSSLAFVLLISIKTVLGNCLHLFCEVERIFFLIASFYLADRSLYSQKLPGEFET